MSDFTHKVFRVGNCAVATYGWAFVNQRNIAGHVGEFAQAVEQENLSPKELADQLTPFFAERLEDHFAAEYDERPEPELTVLGFLVAGIEEGRARSYEVAFPSAKVELLHDSIENPGSAWRGQIDVIARLIKGVDAMNLLGVADTEGKRAEVDNLIPILQKLEYFIPFASMNLQDAIDFAVFAIRTTIDVQRLTHGTAGGPGTSWPGVGGPIEVAAVRPIGGFMWVQRTDLLGERAPGQAEQV